MKRKGEKMAIALARRPIFAEMQDVQINDYIITYIKNRFPKNGPLIGKLPISERDDAVQEIYIDLWENRFSYDPIKADFSTYAFNRGRGVVKDLMTKKNRIHRVAMKIYGENPPMSYLDHPEEELSEAVSKVMSSLKPEYALIMKMRFMEDMSIEKIAESLRCSKQKIYQIISKACCDGKKCMNK
jgi:RNA polymerase sigma factor (sigma-70 family)